MRQIKKIIIHCSATPEGRKHTAEDIDRWHKENEFKAVEYEGKTYFIGYHYVIHLDGTVEVGRPTELVGEHTKGHNKGSIGICYIGGIDKDTLKPKDTRTEAQKLSMIVLIERIARAERFDFEMKKNIPFGKTDNLLCYPYSVFGHNEFNPNKACPCFDVKKEFRE